MSQHGAINVDCRKKNNLNDDLKFIYLYAVKNIKEKKSFLNLYVKKNAKSAKQNVIWLFHESHK